MASITTARLVLRDARTHDRNGLIDLQCDPLVRAHLGGARPRADVEAGMPADPSGVLPDLTFPEAAYVVAGRSTDQFMGTVILDRRSPEAPGHVRPGGNELELSYLLLPGFWGQGYAEEATRALLSGTALRHDEDEPVLVVTQARNRRSIALLRRLGFVERERFELHNATQTLAVAPLHTFRADATGGMTT